MKKFLGITSTLAVLVMAAFLALGWADIQVTVPAWAENAFSSISQPRAAQTGMRTASSNTNGAAQQAIPTEDEALEAAKGLARKLLNYIQTDNKSAFLKLYDQFGEEYKEMLSQSFSGIKSQYSGYNKINVCLYAKYKDIFGYDFVFYRVSGKYPNTKNSSDHGFYTIRKINGQWQLYYPNAEELKELDADAMRRLPRGWQEAAEAGRNCATFGNGMWLDPSLVYEGAASEEMIYMYQNQDKSVDLAVALRNGTDEIRLYKSIQIKITDDKLGTVISQKRNVKIYVNPGQTYVYELHLNKNQLQKNGTWTQMHSDIQTTYK